MNRFGLAVMTFVLVLTQGQRVFALPTYGANCASCHSGARGTVTITGNDTTGNPAEACGAPDRGALRVFSVAPGSTRSLSGTLSGLTSGARYAAVMKGFEAAGREQCGALFYNGDPSWRLQSSTVPEYYTQPLSTTSFTWPGTSTFSFNITVGADTPPDYYELVLATAGRDGSGRFYTESRFYVQVVGTTPVEPTISLNKTALTRSATQGSSPTNDTFTVSNTGGGTLSYTVTDDATWLTVSPSSGLSTGAANTITVQYSTASLAAGTYPAVITVSDANATNSPQTIAVTLTITTGGGTGGGNASAGQTLYNQRCIGCHSSPSALAPSANLITTNLGTISSAMSGITLTTQQVADLKAYLATFSGGGTQTPSIVLSKTALTASAAPGASPPNDSFTVANGGQSTLSYTIADNATWLTVSPSSGSSTGAANTITVQYSTASLAAGTYPARITVSGATATNSPQTVAVTLTIAAGGGTGGGNASAGQTLYNQMCIGCHSSPSALAPVASRITTNLGTINSAMSGITLTTQQVADLKAYLASLSGGGGGGGGDPTGEGFVLSRNADFSTDDRDLSHADTLYMLVFSDRVDFRDMERAGWVLRRDGGGDDDDERDSEFRGSLTNHGNGTFSASFKLSQLPAPSGSGDSQSGDAVAGREVFLRNRCGLCHGFDGSGPEDIRGEDADEIRETAGRGEDHPGGAFPLLTRANFTNIAAYLAVGSGSSWAWSARIEDSRDRTFTPQATISLGGPRFPPLRPAKTIAFDLVPIHDPGSGSYIDNCIGCHGDRSKEVAMDGVTPAAHGRMLSVFNQVGNDRCVTCHPTGPDFLTYSRGGLREQVAMEQVGCTACHGAAGTAQRFYVR